MSCRHCAIVRLRYPGTMPRGPRLDAPGALHHIMARGIERRRIFRGDRDRRDFLHRLAESVADAGVVLYAWCLMPNHVHLLCRTGQRSMSSVLQSVLGGYAATFNRRYHRSGHLFQNRFKSILVEADPYFLHLVRYIHLNPLRAQLVENLEALARFPWSGHSVLMAQRTYPPQDTATVLRHFSADAAAARRAYEQFVAQAVGKGPRPDVSGGGVRRSAGGWTFRTPLERGRERWRSDERILGSPGFVARVLATAGAPPAPALSVPPPAAETIRALCEVVGLELGVAPHVISSRSCRPTAVAARALVSYVAVVQRGLSQAAVARALNVSPPTVLRGCRAGPRLLATIGRDATGLLSQS